MYLWIVSLHVIAIISWMAGILYLYRLLVYQAERGLKDPSQHELLSLMSHRLYRYITMPAMIVAWLAGLYLLMEQPAFWTMLWLQIKLSAVFALSISTIYAGQLTYRFAAKKQPLPSGRRIRILNEVPTLLMVIIVIMVVVKPFV